MTLLCDATAAKLDMAAHKCQLSQPFSQPNILDLDAQLTISFVGAALQYLEKFQGIKFQEPVWFKAGAVILNEPLNYLGQDNLIGARSIIATLAVQVSTSFESLGTQLS